MPENHNDVETLSGRLGGLTKLLEITCDLAAQQDLDRILTTVTSGVCDALDCERASLFLYDPQKEELFTRVVTELEIEEIRSPIGNGITGWVARRKKIANIPDPQVDARWNSAVDRQTGFRTRNIVAAPVLSAHDGRLIGVLELINKRDGEFGEFDEQVLTAFAAHAATALERVQLLNEARRAQELQLSIDVGHRIQSGFMPDKLPVIPGYEVAAWWRPAEAVGGDYYDIVDLPDGRVGLVMADVSGHGIGASLIMASVRAMLHVATRTTSDPGQILSLLAETIAPDLREGRFITFLMVALDPTAHRAVFANAGHGPALQFDRRSGRFTQLPPTCLPIGFSDDYAIEIRDLPPLAPGDLLLLATDGAIELCNEADEMFGRARLQQIIVEHADCPASELTDILSRAITDFCPAELPPDDVTLLLLERKSGDETAGKSAR